MTEPNGNLTQYLPRELQVPLLDLAPYALDRHRQLASAILDDTERAESDLVDQALCQRIDDIDLQLLRRAPAVKGQTERRIVLAALERIRESAHLAHCAVAQMADDMHEAEGRATTEQRPAV